jgi:hypothetical protein
MFLGDAHIFPFVKQEQLSFKFFILFENLLLHDYKVTIPSELDTVSHFMKAAGLK